jgi:chitin disaccharide deacetylase
VIGSAAAARRGRGLLLAAPAPGAHALNRLIITADDFGLSEPVNAAIEEAHRRGILTATSLMVGAAAVADAVARARRLPNLRVGLHVVLTDGRPVSPRADVPGLLDDKGNFRNDLPLYGAQITFDPAVKRQIEREIAAQFEAYRATGLPLDHVDGHRHFQLHPVIARAIVTIGRRHGMKALRVPLEPWPTIAAIDPGAGRRLGRVVAPWAVWLRRRVRGAGLVTADAVFGLAWSGAMTKERLAALLHRLPPGLVEIYFHPATENSFLGAAPGYRYTDEFAALCDADCVAAVHQSGYAVGGYSDVAV